MQIIFNPWSVSSFSICEYDKEEILDNDSDVTVSLEGRE